MICLSALKEKLSEKACVILLNDGGEGMNVLDDIPSSDIDYSSNVINYDWRKMTLINKSSLMSF